MAGSRLVPPPPEELRKSLGEEVSLTALASRLGVSFSTAKKWVSSASLDSLHSPERLERLKLLIQTAPLEAKRRRIDRDLEVRLSDEGDKKLLARAVVDEFNLRYTQGRSGRRRRYILWLKVTMYDRPPVEEVARLMGTRCKMRYRRAKSGVEVPNWNSETNGYRAYRILQMIRPFLIGQKAYQADIALESGPLCDFKVSTGKAVYRELLLSTIPSRG